MACCTGLSNCGCNACASANTIYRGGCTDPGTQDFLTYLSGLDAQFCPYRLAGNTGFLQSDVDGSGNFQITFTDSPSVDLPDTQAVLGMTFGDLVIIDSNNALSRLLGPATANLFLSTNASGGLSFGVLPAATVPDPLTVANLTVTTLAGFANVTISGTLAASGLSAGTPVSFLGLDGSNNVVTQSVTAANVQVAMFFESPTSPGATYPNESAAAGSNLVIGNMLYDSGGTIINVTTSQTLTVAVAGKYKLEWNGMVAWSGGNDGKPQLLLLINGVIVNNGNSSGSYGQNTSQRTAFLSGMEARTLAVGATIQVQLSSTSGANTHVYEVRLIATKLSA